MGPSVERAQSRCLPRPREGPLGVEGMSLRAGRTVLHCVPHSKIATFAASAHQEDWHHPLLACPQLGGSSGPEQCSSVIAPCD